MPTTRSTMGLPAGVHIGQTGPRLLAALVEVGPVWLLIGLALLFSLVLDGRGVAAVLCVLLALAWTVLIWAQRAATAAGLGMRLDSLQIVGYTDGRPIGWGRVVVRGLVYAGLTVTVVGLIAMAVALGRHPRRQGWHDLAADAVVIRERPLPPTRPHEALVRTPTVLPTAGNAPGSPAADPSAGSARGDAVSPPTAPILAPVGSLRAAPVPVPAAPEQSEPAVDGPGLDWWLRLDDGRDVGVDGMVLLGRNPQPRVGEEDATVIKVVDHTRTVSKSHLAVGIAGSGLFVMDRGSTNGTTVTVPEGGQQPCPPGDLVDVPEGSVVFFGDRWLKVRRTNQSG